MTAAARAARRWFNEGVWHGIPIPILAMVAVFAATAALGVEETRRSWSW